MSKEQIKLYVKESKLEQLDTPGLWKKAGEAGYVIFEFFDENIFCKASEISKPQNKYLVSATFFDGQRQLKLRRIEKDKVWIVGDFEFDNEASCHDMGGILSTDETSVFLWGYSHDELSSSSSNSHQDDSAADEQHHNDNEVIEYYYEEKIPYLFSYPLKGRKIPDARKRVALKVTNFLDCCGNVVWSKFGVLQGGKDGKEEAAK